MSEPKPGKDPPSAIFLIAGEISGDLIGAALMRELSTRLDGVTFRGVGGPKMQSRGLVSMFPMEELSLLGIDEIIPNLPNLRRRFVELERSIRTNPPAALITIDCPVFSLRVARRVRDLDIPLIHYVAPTVWLYGKGRARRIARFLDHLLLLFPFEKPYFEKVGLPSTYVGPWILETLPHHFDRGEFRNRYDIAPDTPLLALLPGSRPSVVARLLPIFTEVVDRLAEAQPGLRLTVPTVPAVAGLVRAAARDWRLPAIIVESAEERHAAMAGSTVALAGSGSVTLDLALLGIPSVTVLKFAPLNTIYYKVAATVTYISLPNLILDRPAVPEFFFGRCRPDLIAQAVLDLLGDPEARRRQQADLAEVVARLRVDERPPSVRAADAVVRVIENRRQKGRRGT